MYLWSGQLSQSAVETKLEFCLKGGTGCQDRHYSQYITWHCSCTWAYIVLLYGWPGYVAEQAYTHLTVRSVYECVDRIMVIIYRLLTGLRGSERRAWVYTPIVIAVEKNFDAALLLFGNPRESSIPTKFERNRTVNNRDTTQNVFSPAFPVAETTSAQHLRNFRAYAHRYPSLNNEVIY